VQRSRPHALDRVKLLATGAGRAHLRAGTVGALLERWFEVAARNWATTTASQTRSIIDCHLLPELGPGRQADQAVHRRPPHGRPLLARVATPDGVPGREVRSRRVRAGLFLRAPPKEPQQRGTYPSEFWGRSVIGTMAVPGSEHRSARARQPGQWQLVGFLEGRHLGQVMPGLSWFVTCGAHAVRLQGDWHAASGAIRLRVLLARSALTEGLRAEH